MPPSRLVGVLRNVVGARHLLTDPLRSRPYRTGYRYGEGAVLAVAFPGTLVELWRAAAACVEAGAAIIVQAANTGLTGGSTPFGDYDRPVVILNTKRLDRIMLLRGGREAICLAGATLIRLEKALAPLGRAPHSVIGSSCIGASVVGGICNNSGGTLVARGPAYTRMALYGRVTEEGRLELVNALGLALAGHPETLLGEIDRGRLTNHDFEDALPDTLSDHDYIRHVRDVDAGSPARFNANTRCLHGAAGSAGKVIVFAVRTATFPAASAEHVLIVGTGDPDRLTRLRRAILRDARALPIAAEYLHRDMRELAISHGRDTCFAIKMLGSRRLPTLIAAMRGVDRLAGRIAPRLEHASGQILQGLSHAMPHPLGRRLRTFVARHNHLLLLRLDVADLDEMRALLERESDGCALFDCTPAEGAAIFRLRFAAAGAAIRYAATVKDAGPLVAIDAAFARSDRDWHFALPSDLADQVLVDLRYGHFLCHVFHLDFVLKPGIDAHQFEERMVQWLAARGAKCPAEHNFGHLYAAPPELVDFYRTLDPTNALNPGIGKTSRRAGWQ